MAIWVEITNWLGDRGHQWQPTAGETLADKPADGPGGACPVCAAPPRVSEGGQRTTITHCARAHREYLQGHPMYGRSGEVDARSLQRPNRGYAEAS